LELKNETREYLTTSDKQKSYYGIIFANNSGDKMMAKRVSKKIRESASVRNKAQTGSDKYKKDPVENTNALQKANSNGKIDFEIQNIDFLLKKTLEQWKGNLDSENIKADTIGDLEKLIKLRLLLFDEHTQKKQISEIILKEVISVIREVVDNPELRLKLLEKMKEIDFENLY
jgi:hypothetical protein